MSKYGYSIGPNKRIVYVGDLPKAITAAHAELWDTRAEDDKAHIYREADGHRFVGYVTYDGRFIDQRKPANAR
jgi:hypothetical protein